MTCPTQFHVFDETGRLGSTRCYSVGRMYERDDVKPDMKNHAASPVTFAN